MMLFFAALCLPVAAAGCADPLAPLEAKLQQCITDSLSAANCGKKGPLVEYERALALSRQTPVDYACRTATLNANLCAHAARFLESTNASLTRVAMSGTWARYMKELGKRETASLDCNRFHQFHERRWHPFVFKWADGPSNPRWREAATPFVEWDGLAPRSAVGQQVDRAAVHLGFGGRRPNRFLPADPLYTKHYSQAVEPLTYGPPDRQPQTLNVAHEDGSSSNRTLFRGRAFHASHIALLGLMLGQPRPLRGFRQIVEFGAGSAELADLAPALGFKGLFVIYDLPQMLLMQRYWLRLASRPAYLMQYEVGPHLLKKMADDGEMRVALVSSLHTTAGTGRLWLPATLDALGERMVDTLFLGFWSFTEAAPAARVAIMPVLHQFGTIQISFNGQIQGWDNIAFLAEKVVKPLLATHTVCVWDPFTLPVGRHSRKGGWLIATHKERGARAQVRCVARAGCTKHTLIPFIPSNCEEEV